MHHLRPSHSHPQDNLQPLHVNSLSTPHFPYMSLSNSSKTFLAGSLFQSLSSSSTVVSNDSANFFLLSKSQIFSNSNSSSVR